MNPTERFFVWFLGFVSGFTLARIIGGGGGGWGWPNDMTPPIVPDHIPDEWVKQA